MKCNNCGSENAEGAKFCINCGNKLTTVTDKNVCPECGAEIVEGAKFCGNCGHTVPGGKKLIVKEKVSAAKTKVRDLESRHIIINAVIAFLSLLIACFALFMPIKTIAYLPSLVIMENNYGDVSEFGSSEGKYSSCEVDAHCVEVDQSIWQVMASVGYINLKKSDSDDEEKKERIIDEYNKAVNSAEREARTDAEITANNIWNEAESKIEDYFDELEDELESKLSDINFLGYLLATAPRSYESASNDDLSDMSIKGLVSYLNKDYKALVMTSICALVIAIISIIIAVVSLVSIVFCIVGMVKNKNKTPLNKYSLAMCIISGFAVCVSIMMPFGKAGGGIVAVLVTAALAYILSFCLKAVAEKMPVSKIIGHAVVAVVSMVAVVLFMDNILTSRTGLFIDAKEEGKRDLITFLHSPLGIGLITAFQYFGLKDYIESEDYMGNAKVSDLDYLGDISGAGIAAVIMSIIMIAVLIATFILSLKYSDEGKKTTLIPYVLSAVCTVLAIVCPIVVGVSSQYSESVTVNSYKMVSELSLYMRAQIYFVIAITLAVAMTGIVLYFRNKKANEPQPVEAAQATESVAAAPAADETAEKPSDAPDENNVEADNKKE